MRPDYSDRRGKNGERILNNRPNDNNVNEIYIDRDIMVLANPEIAKLPGWVVALVAAGGLAASQSCASAAPQLHAARMPRRGRDEGDVDHAVGRRRAR